jgi:cytochrome P450
MTTTERGTQRPGGVSFVGSFAGEVNEIFSTNVRDIRLARYRELASRGGIHRVETPVGPAWLVTDYLLTRRLLSDERLLKAESPTTAITRRLVPDLAPGLSTHMLTFDPPEHTRLRKLVTAGFTRRRIEALAPRIRQIADDLLDDMAVQSVEQSVEQSAELPADTGVDLINAYAFPLPMTVICELIGVPEPARADFRAWTQVLTRGYFADQDQFVASATAQTHYLRQLVADKRRNPGDDLLSALVAVRDGGDRLSEDELTSMAWILVVAGHETTVNLIANGMHALLSHPEQLTLLRACPELMESAVEELLRFDGPLQIAVPMRAREPIEIDGNHIRAGETVLAGLLGANRDAERFANPDTLDITRTDNAHLAFGHGVHHCLGAPLARLEGKIALARLLDRFPRLRLAVPPSELSWNPNYLLHSLTRLPLTLTLS